MFFRSSFFSTYVYFTPNYKFVNTFCRPLINIGQIGLAMELAIEGFS